MYILKKQKRESRNKLKHLWPVDNQQKYHCSSNDLKKIIYIYVYVCMYIFINIHIIKII